MGKGRIAIITEGAAREPKYFGGVQQVFFPKNQIDFLCLPTGGTIYSLWRRMQREDFQTDLIEEIRDQGGKPAKKLEGKSREDFQEIYLFYDFDPQQADLVTGDSPDVVTVLREMMKTFDNETELGKLYISYPMVEALRDAREWTCEPYFQCEVPLEVLKEKKYKQKSGDGNTLVSVNAYTEETWTMLLAIFLTRCRCLFPDAPGPEELCDWYKAEGSQEAILKWELEWFGQRQAVFVLSAFPAWLLDYFRRERWITLTEDLKQVVRPACGAASDKTNKDT